VGSGKTTFLAALYIAVNRSEQDLNIFGVDDTSTEFMVESNRILVNEHRFPTATDRVGSYSWVMNMTSVVDQQKKTRLGRQTTAQVPVPTQFNIDLRDAPGGFFGTQQSQPRPLSPSRTVYGAGNGPSRVPDTEDMTDYLGGCEGLLLLIDPVREQELGDSHEYFRSTLLRVAQRRLASMPPGSRLPHYVAICITKFDHPQVYRFARLKGYRTYDETDPYLFPRVHEEDAKIFFRDFCRNSAMSDADLITNALDRYFHPQRIRYFVTSAIGFYPHRNRFLDDDFDNAQEQSDGSYRIRGRIHPINVLEPVLWLGQSVTMMS
jgi:hypothetical protein